MFRTYKRSCTFHSFMEVFKSFRIFRTYTDELLYAWTFRHCIQNMFGNDFFSRSNNHFDSSGLAAVNDIFLSQQVGSRNHYCPYLVKGNDREPEFITAFQNQHHLVAMSDTQTLEVRSRHIGIFFQISISKLNMFSFIVCPKKSVFIRTLGSPCIYYIITKVKVFGHFYFEVLYKILL